MIKYMANYYRLWIESNDNRFRRIMEVDASDRKEIALQIADDDLLTCPSFEEGGLYDTLEELNGEIVRRGCGTFYNTADNTITISYAVCYEVTMDEDIPCAYDCLGIDEPYFVVEEI